METKERKDIISSYGTTLLKYPMSIKSEKVLPSPKSVIRRAIIEEMLYTTDSKDWDVLENGFVLLEEFVPQEEFETVEPCQKFVLDYRNIDKNAAIDGKKLALLLKELCLDIYVEVNQKITGKTAKRGDQFKVLKEMIIEL